MKKLMKGFVAALVVMLGVESAQAYSIVTNDTARNITMKVGETAFCPGPHKTSSGQAVDRWWSFSASGTWNASSYATDLENALQYAEPSFVKALPSNSLMSDHEFNDPELTFKAIKVTSSAVSFYIYGATAVGQDIPESMPNRPFGSGTQWSSSNLNPLRFNITVEAFDPVVPGAAIPTNPDGADAYAAAMNANKKTYLKAPNGVAVQDSYYGYFTAVPNATKTAISFVLDADGSNAVANAQLSVKPEIPLADIANAAMGETFAPDAMAGFYYTLVQGGSLDSMTAGDPKLAGDSGFSFTAQKQGNLGYYRFIVSPYAAKPTDLSLDEDGTNTVAAYGFKASGIESPTPYLPFIREAVVAAWASQAADGGEISLDDLVDKGCFAEGDKIYAYKAETGSYEGWVLNASGEWEGMSTVKVGARTIPSGATPAGEKTFRAGEVFWAERADATKPLLLCGGIATDAALPELKTGANLIGAAGFKAVDLDAAFPAPAAEDRVTLPIAGKQPRTYSFKDGKWGYKASVKDEETDIVSPKWTEDGELPAGAGFWYKKAESDPE